MRHQSPCRLLQLHPLTRALRNAGLGLLLTGVSVSPLIHAETVSKDSQTNGETPKAAKQLKTVKVTAEAVEGTKDTGYRTETVSGVGAWEGRSLQDTPYSVNVISEELIENLQATTPDQIYRVNPTTQLIRAQHENNQPRIMMRGFSVQRSYRDGVPDDQYNHSATMEDTARIEILNGLSGFMYGANNVGGVTNYVTKRSTDERMNQLTLSSLGGDSWNAHGDFGGKFDSDGNYGYRVNLVEQGGDGAIKNQAIEKTFYSLALDGYLFEDFWVQIHGMDYTYDVNGSQTYWYFANGVKRPSADSIDNEISWGQPWTNRWYDYNRYGTNVKWKISENVSFRAAYIDNRGDRGSESTSNTIAANGTYSQAISGVYTSGLDTLLSKQKDSGAAAYLDVVFETGEVVHKLTTGYQVSDSFQYRYTGGASAPNINLTGLSMGSPTYIPHPTNVKQINRGVITLSSNTEYHSFIIGDDITFNDQWSALLGAAQTTITQKTGTGYDESALTPSVSVLFKPVESITTYVSYVEGLEAGVVVPEFYNNTAVKVVNGGKSFDPLTSEQFEIGVKTKVGQLALDAAVFRIEKGLQYYINVPGAPEFVQDGLQVHQGIELTAMGNLTENLNLIGGFTWLDPEVKEQKQTPALEGKAPVDVAEKIVKARFEYTLPAVPNLSLSAAVNYNGASYGDTLNNDKVPDYTLFDLGARYQVAVAEQLVTLRADLHNLTNEHYWNGFNGTRIGDPRTLMLSATVEF